MNKADILKRIPNKEGAGFFSVFLPSLGIDLKMRHLSINDQKIISKLSVSEDSSLFASEADLAKIALAEENSLEEVDLTQIDLRDYFILCCALRKENYINPLAMSYKCQRCSEQVNHNVDFARLITAASEFELVDKDTEVKTSAGEAKLVVGIPHQMDLVMMEMYYDRIAQTRTVTMTEKYVDYIVCCIKSVEFKNDAGEYEPMADFLTMDYLEKLQFLQEIKVDIEELTKLFADIGIMTAEFFYDIQCPNCKNEIKSFVDTSDFFVL